MGRHFIIHTNQRSLRFLTDQSVLGEEHFKWTSKLIGMDFEIKYKLGSDNKAADALSRRMTYAAISTVQFSELDDWEEEAQSDSKLQTIIQDLIRDSTTHPGFSFQYRKLLYKGILV